MSFHLSDQERRVIYAAANGNSDKECAVSLGVSLGTVTTYWKRIRFKLQVSNRTRAVAIVLKNDFHELHGAIEGRTSVALTHPKPAELDK